MKFYKDEYEKIKDIIYYTLKRVLSFCVSFMYLIGGRRYGKTYTVKSFVISDFVKNGNKFAWVRTTDIALQKINTEQFFGRMENLKDLGVESYYIKNNIVYINNEIAGYLFAISTFHNLKGADYKCVNVVYDEFMRAKGERPVPARREKFMDLIESICRDDGKRVFLISNATNQFDEMLQPFNITLKEYGCYLFREQNSVIHYIRPSDKHKERMENSLSGKGMNEQDKKMAFDNKFTSYGDFNKESKAKYIYTLQVDDDKFLNIYFSNKGLYIKMGTTKEKKYYTNNPDFVSSKVKKLTTQNKKILQHFYNNGETIYENGYCRTMFQTIIL